MSCFALKKKWLHYGDLIIMTAGFPFGVSGATKMIIAESIGSVLVRGTRGYGPTVYGKIIHLPSSDPTYRHLPTQDRIVVLTHCDRSFISLLKGAKGIVLQNLSEDLASETCAWEIAEQTGLSLIVRAENALNLLSDHQLVTLDPSRALIYQGSFGSSDEMIASICPL
jgi:pyruvate kinase